MREPIEVKLSEGPWHRALLLQAAPVLVAALVIALADQVASADQRWTALGGTMLGVVGLLLPALAAHVAACRWRPAPAGLAWLTGFLAYPATLHVVKPGGTLTAGQWALVAGFSAIFLLLHPGARQHNGRPGRAGAPIQRLPLTLDGTVAALLGLWVLGTTSLFASTPDAVRNQPLRVLLDWRRIAAEPGEALWYLVQFSALGVTLYGWYWACRHVLVRRVLHRHGMIPFGFATLALLALGAPAASSLGLLLPLNIPEWTIIPSENHNPFDWTNYSFAIWLTVIILPIVLAVERLLTEQAEASNRHERMRAELHLLQQQINPHFLFNTLNTLYALCLQDRAESAAAVIKLSDLLRYVVYRGPEERVTLDEEIDYLRNYLDLQQLRFGHRCTMVADWPPTGSGLALPPLLLIMLVENAFKHGVEPSDGACEVRISATTEGGRLHFFCVNSLPVGRPDEVPGMGLANLRRRLELLFGQDFHLSTKQEGSEWQARLELDLEPC